MGRRTAIRDHALSIGFDAVGFAPATLAASIRADLSSYLQRGYHGDMGWMAETEERRGDPLTLWSEARSVVALGINYAPSENPLAHARDPDEGIVSVYAQGRDYHDLIKRRLKELGRWIARQWPGELKVFVDTAPVMEKPLAQRAGIGWQGKHTNLVSREFGSWLFLGEIFLSIDLGSDPEEADHCGSCSRCLDACPTKAFPEAYQLDARRCISYLTIEHKGHIDAALRPLMGNRIFGCDDCLAVCPWNKYAQPLRDGSLMRTVHRARDELGELAALDDASFRSRFAGSPVKRIGRARFLRNVLIAIGNSGLSEFIPVLIELLSDPSPLVRAMAVWALSRLAGGETVRRLHASFGVAEPDHAVGEEWKAALSLASG
ncbi:MAG: queG [Rhodospirillales bacterium]|nr:queG [Rhodospirillales bacterium]